MKTRYSKIAIEKLCGLFGKSRLAWYDRSRREEVRTQEHILVLEMVRLVRSDLDEAGTPILYRMLKPKFDQVGIKLGRDGLHQLLLDHGLTIKARRRRYPQTTWSQHWLKKWPNLIKEIEVVRPMHIWVADITYLRLADDDFCYLSLLTDSYSRLVVGWCLSLSLSHQAPLAALRMALERYPLTAQELIHHSDRGVQYCCNEYISLLQNNDIGISMTDNGDPYENPIAERINKTFKYYLGLKTTFKSFEQALAATAEKVRVYNEIKPHSSCDYLTPKEAHLREGPLKHWWKKGKRYQKKNEDQARKFGNSDANQEGGQ